MNLRSLTLTNFQKHTSLKLQFSEGVNIIYGPSDAGKSCIRRAISFLFFGSPHHDGIRKEGTKQTSVSAILSSGWEVERIKSASINRIILRKDGIEKTFDAIGSNIPDEVKTVLEVRELEIADETLNLNIAEQVTLPFLEDKPATFRAKLFNTLTGNDLLDKVVQNINKELLSFSREGKSEAEFVTKNEPILLQLKEEIEKKKLSYTQLQNLIIQAKDKYKTLNNLQQIDLNLASIKENIEKFTWDLQKLSKVLDLNKLDKIREKIKKFEILKSSRNALLSNDNIIKASQEVLGKLRLPSIDITKLRGSIEVLARLKVWSDKLRDNWQEYEAKREEFANICQKETDLTQKYRDLVKQAPICSSCKQILNPNHIIKEI